MKPLTPEEWQQVERWAADDPDLMITRLASELIRLRREVRVVRSLLEAHRDPRPIRERR